VRLASLLCSCTLSSEYIRRPANPSRRLTILRPHARRHIASHRTLQLSPAHHFTPTLPSARPSHSQSIQYFESVLTSTAKSPPNGHVSRARMMPISSARLFVCARPGRRSERFLWLGWGWVSRLCAFFKGPGKAVGWQMRRRRQRSVL
jgi:hypothetical protein